MLKTKFLKKKIEILEIWLVKTGCSRIDENRQGLKPFIFSLGKKIDSWDSFCKPLFLF
jgi:hypothetical protein